MKLKRDYKKEIFDGVKIFIIAVAFALAYNLFIIPNDFAPAGLNGIATMIQYKFGFSIGYFSLIINIPLCIYAFFKVDREFAVKSLIFCLSYSASYLLFQGINLSAIAYDAKGVDTIFPCLIAGMVGGVVYGLCFRLNSSTGGTDIVAKAISQKKPLLNFFWVTFAMNAVVAVVSLFVYGKTEGSIVTYDYKPVCLCILYCFMSSFIGNRILQGYKTAYQFIIITPHSQEIEEEILAVLHHSATRLYGKGVYSEENKDVLLCVVNKHQIVDFKNILKKYSETFAFIQTVNETVGNFKKIK